LIEFPFATFFGQKWDVVVVGVTFPSCYFHALIVIFRQASRGANTTDHYRYLALLAELKLESFSARLLKLRLARFTGVSYRIVVWIGPNKVLVVVMEAHFPESPLF
jgi:hypothetical protein